jgi:hypothetical protein
MISVKSQVRIANLSVVTYRRNVCADVSTST